MKNYLSIILLLISLGACNKVNKNPDISNKYINELSKTTDYIYSLVSNEQNSLWRIYREDIIEFTENIDIVLSSLEKNKELSPNLFKNKTFYNDLIDFIPGNFEQLPRNYKKLIVISFKQKEMNRILNFCLNSSYHYFAVQTIVEKNKDSVSIGELISIKLKQRATTFRDSVFIIINGKSEFIGLDTNGAIIYSRVEKTSGLKNYKGYFKNTLLGNTDNTFEIEYYVK